MFASVEIVFSKVVSVTLELVRRKIVTSIEDGDVALSDLKSLLLSQLEELKSLISKILDEPLQNALINMQHALVEVSHGDFEGAKPFFETCKAKAEVAFQYAQQFMDKSTAIRLRLMSFLYLNGFFGNDCNIPKLGEHCKLIVEQLLDTAEVKSSIRDEFEPSVLSMASFSNRQEVLAEVVGLLRFMLTSFNVRLYVTDSRGNPVNLLEYPLKMKHYTGTESYSEGVVTVLTIHEDRLYSGGFDGNIKVWDLPSLKLIRNLYGVKSNYAALANRALNFTEGHEGCITGLVIVNDKLYSASGDNRIKIWELKTLRCEITLNVGKSYDIVCKMCTFAVSGDTFYLGASDGSIRAWDGLNNRKLSKIDGHCTSNTFLRKAMNTNSNSITCLLIFSDKLISASDDSNIILWDLSTLQEITTLRGHSGSVTSIIVHDDRLYSSSSDNTIRIWDLTLHSSIAVLSGSLSRKKEVPLTVTALASAAVVGTAIPTIASVFLNRVGVTSLHIHAGKLYAGCSNGAIKVWELAYLNEVECDYDDNDTVTSLTVAHGALYHSNRSGFISRRYL